MALRRILLSNLLRPLIDEWGYEEVRSALVELSGKADPNGWEESVVNRANRKRRAPKLLASEQVALAQLSKVQEEALREIAGRFDSKQFLPSTSDVREFLIMMGERPGLLKDRSAAFKRLLSALAKLPADRLRHITDAAHHSGPSSLGPLSDAIADVAASLSRVRNSESS